MNIGTAKPTKFELDKVPHFFINNLSIHDSYSVGKFIDEANDFFNYYYLKNDLLIMVGGSGLFIDGLLKGLDPFPSINEEIRSRLNSDLEDIGLKKLSEKLKRVDPNYYDIVDLNNPRRVIRALEVYYSSNKPYSSFIQGNNSYRNDLNINFIGLNPKRDKLNKRIELRVDDMILNGLVNEAKKLYQYKDLNALKTVGYSEIFQYIDGRISLNDAIDKIKSNTRKYSKRQMTWFKKNKEVFWYEDGIENIKKILKNIKF
tara:strand:- start:13 stop:789 length:777 start_codon:yes stop_codon:yes gene_type:complete